MGKGWWYPELMINKTFLTKVSGYLGQKSP
jgi:hypothetical protein